MTIVKTIIIRAGTATITLLVVSMVIFTTVELLPGDMATRVLGRFATQEDIERFNERLRLNRPPAERYAEWLGSMIKGDFGTSLVTDRRVSELVLPRLRNTAILAGFALVLYVPVTILGASLAAIYQDKLVDGAISVLTLVGLSTPVYVSGILFLILFAVTIPIFPVIAEIEFKSFVETLHILTLPAITLAIVTSVYAIRMLRDNLIEVFGSDYVRMATLKGLPRHQVVLRHALPNALAPALNVTAINMAYLIGGVVLVENIFSFEGLGTLLVDAIYYRDAPVVELVTLIVSAVYILGNLIADVAAIIVNPRLRAG